MCKLMNKGSPHGGEQLSRQMLSDVLGKEDRELQQHLSPVLVTLRSYGRKLGRHHATIARELKRGLLDRTYQAGVAQKAY